MKLFLPIIDNGNADVKADWAIAMVAGLNGLDVQLARISDSHANRAMNKAAAMFLAGPCDAMLVIDCDIVFRVKDVQQLIKHDVPLVYGIYPKKEEACSPCLCTFDTVPEPDANGLAVVRRAGRGFMLVRREVFEKMKEENGGPALRFHNHGEVQWDFFPSGPVSGAFSVFGDRMDGNGAPLREWLSEDWMFCERARALGYPTLVDTGIALGHQGTKIYRFGMDQLCRMDSEIKSWKEIHGWFDYEKHYRDLVKAIPSGGTFVEVGSWLGRSCGAFFTFAREADKAIAIHAVDTFDGKAEGALHAEILKAFGGSVGPAFLANMKALGMNGQLHVHEKDSAKAAEDFADQSVDAVFIDADHSYESVKRDILAWLPKVKPFGIISGHDIDELGVCGAVQEIFRGKHTVNGRCWVFHVEPSQLVEV